MDVRGDVGDNPVQSRGSHIPEAVALQVAVGGERAPEEFRQTGRGLDGRVQRILLSEDWP